MTVEWTSITEQISLKIRRCWKCGNFWALEGRAGDRGYCPSCAYDRIEEVERETSKAQRAAAALRGLVTRMKSHRRSSR